MRTNRIIKSLPFILLMVLLCNSVFAKEKVLLPLGFNQTWSARLLFNSEGGYSGYMNNEENSIHGWSKLYEAQENDAYSISMPTKVSNVEHGRVQFKTPITLLSNHSYRFQATLYADKSVPELLLQLSENENDNSVFFSQTLSIEAGKSINISSTGLRGTDIEDMKLALYIATEEENTTIILSGIRLYDETEQKEIWVGTSYYNYCYYWYEVGRYRIKDMVIDGRVETLSWADANFDDSMWKEAEMPIGERGYMSEVKTEWPGGDNTNFWIRRDFELDELNESASYYVLVCHDDTYSIYVNGHLIDSQIDWTSGKDYKTLEVPVQYLNVGKNVIATYIQQNWGGKFYDCGMKIVEKNILIYDEGTSADGSEGIDKLFDDDTSTKWCNVNYDSPRYVIFHSPEPIVVTGYEITTANDAESYSERNPRSWTLYGFDGAYNPGKDADAWEVIASITNDTLLQAANFATSTYTLPAPTSKAYQYFMWVITEPSEHFVQVSEFFLKYTKKSVSPGEFQGAKRIFGDNLLKSSTNDDKTFTYHYDGNGFVTQIDRVKSSGSSKTYTITYGDKIVVNCSDGNRWTATMNSQGFIAAMDYKDDKGNAEHVTFTYNDNNQLSKVDYGDGDVFTLTYTDGNITRVTNYDDVIDFGYESSGQGRISNTGKVMEFGRIYGIDMDDFNLLYYIGALGYPTKHLPLYGIVDGATITGSWTTDDAGRAIKAQFSNRSLTWNWDDNGGGQGGEQDFQTDNTLSFADNMKTNAGSEFTLPIMMTNKDAISGVQFDLYLPKGIEVCKDEYEDYLIELSRTTIRRHSIASRVMPDGALRVVISSTQNSTFTGNSGQLLSLLLLANSTLEAGNYEVMLKNIVLTDPDAKRYVVADVKSYINVKKYTLGDVNNDGYIDVADLAGVVRFILENADASLIFNAADMDGNGVVEINDYAALVNVILNQSTPSAALKRRANSLRNTLVTLSDYRQNTQGEGELMVHIGSNGMLFTGMQFDLRLPEGVELMEEGTEAISIQHETCMQKLANGKYRVICASITNNELPEGDVVRLKLRVANDVDNILEFMADNIVLSDVNAIRHEASPVNIAINMDDATGIVDLSSTFSGSNGTIYDLCGRKIISQFTIFNSQLSKGIYIVNGKKVSLK